MSSMTVSVTLAENGSIPIPEDMRRALGLSPHQKLRLRRSENGLVVEFEPAEPASIRERAAQMVKEAKLQAAYDAAGMTADEVWSAYEAAAKAVRHSLTYQRKRRR